MLSLADVQRELARAIVTRGGAELGFLAGSPAEAAMRLDVHRRHFRRSLTRALEKIYPAVASLVDQRFFAYCGDAFIVATPPVKPCLFEYGAGFADFLAAFEPCLGLPYLPRVARLEWDIHAHDMAVEDEQKVAQAVVANAGRRRAVGPQRWRCRRVSHPRAPC